MAASRPVVNVASKARNNASRAPSLRKAIAAGYGDEDFGAVVDVLHAGG
jgi:hypothetical protein